MSTTTNPRWPEDVNGPRALVECEDAAIQDGLMRVLREHGYAVAACAGPQSRSSGVCPLVDEGACGLVAGADVVLDCSDNFKTRHAVNAACVKHKKPLVSGAAIGFDGQISVYDTRTPDAPCYACIFPAEATYEEVQCATMGVFAPLVGIIGTMQAAEALKLLMGIGSSLAGRLQMVDARSMEWNEIRMARQAACTVCSWLRE